MKNSILNYENMDVENLNLEDYFSLNPYKLIAFNETIDETFFDYYQIKDDDLIEKISYDLYSDENYWDLLLVINQKNPLFDMVYSEDTVMKMTDDFVDLYPGKISDNHKAFLVDYYNNKAIEKNESMRTLKIVRPTRLQEYLQLATDYGCFE